MLFNPNADAAIFAATQHIYQHPTGRFSHPGLGVMTPDQRNDFVDKAVLGYITGHDPGKGSRIMAFTTAGAIVQPDRQTLSAFADHLYFDDRWKMAFMPVMLAEGEVKWEIHNVNNPIIMTEIAEGGQTRTQRVDSTKTEYEALRYGSEIGFTEQMLVGNRLSMFVTSIEQLRTAYQRAISDSHYSVLATASTTGAGTQITYQGNATESVLSRDIKTINEGLGKIEGDLKDVAPEEVESGSYVLYVQGIALKGRTVAAVAASLASLTNERVSRDTSAPVQRTVMVASTLNSNVPADKGILVLAGRKLQTADAGARSYQVLDPKSENLCRMLWARWGVAAADSRQAVELSFS